MSYEIKQTLRDVTAKLEQLRSCLDLAGKEKRLAELEESLSSPRKVSGTSRTRPKSP